MGNMLLVPENLMAISGAYATVPASASASMAGTNMLLESPSKFWRSTGVTPSKRYSYFYKGNTAQMYFNTVSIVGHNLYSGDQYRIWTKASGSPPSPISSLYDPTGNVAGATSNTAVSWGDLDNGEGNTSLTWLGVPTSTSSVWSYGCSFATPIAPGAGTSMQEFWVYVKKSSSTNRPDPPTVTATLWEGGASVVSLGTKAIQSSTGQWICFPWSISSLALNTAANVELKLSFTVSANGQYGMLNTIIMGIDGFGSTRDNNSGWLTYTPYVSPDISYKPEGWGKGQSVLYRFPTDITASYVVIEYRVNQSPSSWSSVTETLPTPQGYIQIGTVVIGQSWSPTVNIGYGKLVAGLDPSLRKRTYGGQLFGSRRPVRRVIGMKLAHLPPDEAFVLFDRIIWRHGIMKPIFIALLPDDSAQSVHTGILAVLRNPENWINIQPDEGYENNMDMDWEEVP